MFWLCFQAGDLPGVCLTVLFCKMGIITTKSIFLGLQKGCRETGYIKCLNFCVVGRKYQRIKLLTVKLESFF